MNKFTEVVFSAQPPVRLTCRYVCGTSLRAMSASEHFKAMTTMSPLYALCLLAISYSQVPGTKPSRCGK